MIPTYLLHSITEGLRHGVAIPDSFFDQIYPDEIQKVSITHWTPLEVVLRVIKYFNNQSLKFLDVGSGSGKFCLAGGLISKDHEFWGVEKREELTLLAQDLAAQLGLTKVQFKNADAFDLDWNDFDVLYFFNPFWENHLANDQRIDQKLPVKKEEYFSYINSTVSKLSLLKKGTHVITYHGFGGKFPPSFECIHFESCGTDQIKIWLKTK